MENLDLFKELDEDKRKIICGKLKKLNKDTLIDIIMTGKLPTDLEINSFIKIDNDKEQNYGANINFEIQNELISCQKQQINVLKATISDKNTIISLLKQKRTQPNEHVLKSNKITNSGTRPLEQTEVMNATDYNSPSNSQISSAAVNNSSNDAQDIRITNNNDNYHVEQTTSVNSINPDDSNYTRVTNRKRRNPNNTGESNNLNSNKTVGISTKSRTAVVGSSEDDSEFRGVNSKCWLHVSRVAASTTESGIVTYMKAKLPGNEFSCNLLKTNNDISSFKVGANLSLLDSLVKPEFWPKGVNIRRFNFFRGPRGNFDQPNN